MSNNIGIPLKYDIQICVLELDFVNENSRQNFKNDFDEVYNLFAHKLGNLMREYGVSHVNSKLSEFVFTPKA